MHVLTLGDYFHIDHNLFVNTGEIAKGMGFFWLRWLPETT